MSSDTFSLKDCLIEYLSDQMSQMPTIEAQIIEYEPVKISDDGKHFLEISGISDDVLDKVQAGKFFKIVLKDWEFKWSKVPNSQEYYIDVKASKFDVIELSKKEKPHSNVDLISNVLNDVDVKFLFRQKRNKMTNETSRAKIMIQSPYKSGNATPNKKKSTIKIAKKSPKFGTEALGKMTLENAIEMDDILTTSQNYNRIREPIAKSPLRTPNKAPLNEDRDSTAIKGSPNTRFHGTNFDKITITNIEVGEDDQESLGRRKVAVYNEDFYKEQDKRLKIGDIFEGFKKKRINWDQVVFNQETVDFLKQNVHTLLKSDE